MDKDNVPVQAKRSKRNSDTNGELWVYVYDISLDVKPALAEIKPIEPPVLPEPASRVKEGLAAALGPSTAKSTEVLKQKWKCPSCGRDNLFISRICMNCAKPKPKLPAPEQEKKDKNDKKFLGIF